MEDNAKERKKGAIVLALIFLAVLVIVVLISTSDYRQRKKYSSDIEMMSDLKGRWINCNSDGKINIQFRIDGKNYSEGRGEREYTDSAIIAYRPQKGMFFLDGIQQDVTYYVYKDGTIKDKRGHVFQKDDTAPVDILEQIDRNRGLSTDEKEEKGYNPFSFSDVTLATKDGKTTLSGTVINCSKSTYISIELEGTFLDSRGTVLATDRTVLAEKEGLKPGDTIPFSMTVNENSQITSYDITVLSFDW